MSYLRPGYCQGEVYVRDTYRVAQGISSTGRHTTAHFSMHYRRRRCARKIPFNQVFCWQHRKKEEKP